MAPMHVLPRNGITRYGKLDRFLGQKCVNKRRGLLLLDTCSSPWFGGRIKVDESRESVIAKLAVVAIPSPGGMAEET